MLAIPIVTVVDEVGGPHVTIITGCSRCTNAVVSYRKIDARELMLSGDTRRVPEKYGKEDGEAWLNHLRDVHGVEQ